MKELTVNLSKALFQLTKLLLTPFIKTGVFCLKNMTTTSGIVVTALSLNVITDFTMQNMTDTVKPILGKEAYHVKTDCGNIRINEYRYNELKDIVDNFNNTFSNRDQNKLFKAINNSLDYNQIIEHTIEPVEKERGAYYSSLSEVNYNFEGNKEENKLAKKEVCEFIDGLQKKARKRNKGLTR